MTKIGIRREDKNIWERRVPIIPPHISELAKKHGIEFIVQPSDIRIFGDKDYKKAGAELSEDLSGCPIVFAVKEIPEAFFRPGGVYVFFAHVIKGQKYNMPMLKKIMELGCTLIDYEKIEDEKGRRLIFFGRHAGLAGMVDTLWAFGKRLEWEGVHTPFAHIKPAYEYSSLKEIREEIGRVGENIASAGLSPSLTPLISGFAGYGHVSRGAQEIFDLLPVREIPTGALIDFSRGKGDNNEVYKVVFKEEDMVTPVDPSEKFELQDYYDHPEKYRGVFERYLPHLTIMMNCIYWDTPYPRLVTKRSLKDLYTKKDKVKLKIIGDISCDVNGAVEATVKSTDPGNPIFVYDVDKDRAVDGLKGNGPVIMAVDNLPCEIARESSTDFSRALEDFIPAMAHADYSVPFEDLDLPREIKDAVIVYRGELAPDYRYLEKYL